jgi:hypothetical protein
MVVALVGSRLWSLIEIPGVGSRCIKYGRRVGQDLWPGVEAAWVE